LNNTNTQDLPLSRLSKRQRIITRGVLLVAIGFLMVAVFMSPPVDFPINQVVIVEKGQIFNEISQNFKQQKLIRSSLIFETLAWMLGKETEVKAGEYFFEERIGAVGLIKRITNDTYQNNLVKITIPEGCTLKDIASFFINKGIWQTVEFDKSLEGYLFPDTYYIPVSITPEAMAAIMKETFDKKVLAGLSEEIKNNERDLSDIIIMASLLEKEASRKRDKQIIAGILWKRLDVDFALQVDAVFPFIIGKNTFELTLEDLKIDSPYNTYLYTGLPPGPICNPGLDSIKAALNPVETANWYYLSDKEGNTYYSKTYEEHLIKKEKYLK